jgi:hypothetical protein
MSNSDQTMRTISSGRVLIAIIIASVFLVGFLCLFSGRIGQNDWLQREARFLRASRRIWYQNGTNVDMQMPSDSVNGLHGTVVLINKEVLVDGQKQKAELAWTNSCLGPGALIITESNAFLWRETDGKIRKLNIPNLDHIPIWWYLEKP